MVQAFGQFSDDVLDGDLAKGTTSYAATCQLQPGQTSVSLDVTNWTDSGGQQLASLDGYPIKVWMEDASGGSSLATATEPDTFVGSNGSIANAETAAAANQRVFALKNDLQTSWGDLSKLTASDLSNVTSGSTVAGTYEGDSFVTGKVAGVGATNQKIYFGTAATGDPLEVWIAGRETYASGKSPKDGDGTIDSTGEIMTLYQAKSVERRPFNARMDDYKALCPP